MNAKCADCANRRKVILRRKDPITRQIRIGERAVCAVYQTKMSLDACFLRCRGEFYDQRPAFVAGGKGR